MNGAFTNPRYVSGAMQGTKDYVASKVNPVLMGALSEVARCKPAEPKAFIVKLLRTGEAPAPEEAKGGEGGYDEVFAQLNSDLGSLMKKLMMDQVRHACVQPTAASEASRQGCLRCVLVGAAGRRVGVCVQVLGGISIACSGSFVQ